MADVDTLLRLDMEPVDSLFFRDARPFEPAGHGESGLPMPQTLAGAVRSLLMERHGVDFGQLGERMKNGVSFAEALGEFGSDAAGIADLRISGPWFTLDGGVLVPTPASLRQEKKGGKPEKRNGNSGRVLRLDPLKSPPAGWRPDTPEMLPLWRYGREDVEAAPDLLKLSGLRRFLAGDLPEPCELVQAKDVYGFEDRTGIGVDAEKNAAAGGAIYGIRMLVLKSEACLCAELSGSAAALSPLMAEPLLMKFGGEGRQVVVRAERRGIDWPDVPRVAGKGRLVLLTTPSWFNGWKPPGLEPLAAAVVGHQAVSGWDLAKGGPKPNRFMVPAGSVYFLQPDARILNAFGSDEDVNVGWGCFLEGNWDYADDKNAPVD